VAFASNLHVIVLDVKTNKGPQWAKVERFIGQGEKRVKPFVFVVIGKVQ